MYNITMNIIRATNNGDGTGRIRSTNYLDGMGMESEKPSMGGDW